MKKVWWGGGLVILVLAALLWVLFRSQAASHGLTRTLPAQNERTERPDQKYSGQNFSFHYPGRFQTLPKLEGERAVEGISLNDSKTSQAISVSLTTEASLADDTAVRLRQAQSEYQPVQVEAAGLKGAGFTKHQPDSERSAFFYRDGRVLDVVMTGPTGSNLDDDFQAILASLTWR